MSLKKNLLYYTRENLICTPVRFSVDWLTGLMSLQLFELDLNMDWIKVKRHPVQAAGDKISVKLDTFHLLKIRCQKEKENKYLF